MVQKYRNFVSIGYPESLPDNWLDLLKDMHIKAFVSPLHQFDVDETGEYKKAHYHIILMYDSAVTVERATSDYGLFGVTTLVKPVKSLQGMARYLCHMDDSNKYQYSSADVLELSGADYSSVVTLQKDFSKIIFDILDYIDKEQVYSYGDFLRYCRKERPEWLDVLLRNTATVISIKEFCRSIEWESVKFEQRLSKGNL